MTWIPCSARKSITIHAPLEKVYAYLADPERSGKHWGGVDRIENIGNSQYRWLLQERSTAGIKFKGDYVTKYTVNGKDEINWAYVSGNFKTGGRHRLTASGDSTIVDMSVENEADAPVPALLKSVAKIFAQSETDKSLETFADGVRRALESGAA
ncbi:MAG: SRPBCC family protein [Deltaproteobacteria bacterium]|nr:SRPBCC family protein [Deltaproteobacteria bacterium]